MTDLSTEPKRGRSNLAAAGLSLVVLLAVAAGLTVANYRFAATSAGGNDFIPRWLGTRLMLTEGQNPYSEETSLAIQEFMYGRPARANEDQALFVYPLYSAILFAPFALIGDYVLARALWMTTLEVALLALAFIALRLAKWRPSMPLLILVFLFVLVWYHSARPLINGNASILVALFIAAALLLIRAQRDVAAGVLLAMTTIKPQAIILFIPLILLWAYSRGRYRLIASTVACLAMLFLLAALFEPTWLWQELQQVSAYPDYTLAGTPGAIFATWWPAAGRWIGVVLTSALGFALLWQWRVAWNREFAILLPVAIFTLAATNLIGVTTAVSNYVALFPGLILLFVYWRRDTGAFRDWPAVLLMIVLLAGLWALFWTSRSGHVQSPIMLFPLPMLLVLLLPVLSRAAVRSRQID